MICSHLALCQMGKLAHWNQMPNQIINAKGWRINLTTDWLLYDQQHSQLTSHSVIFNPLLNHVNSDGSVHMHTLSESASG